MTNPTSAGDHADHTDRSASDNGERAGVDSDAVNPDTAPTEPVPTGGSEQSESSSAPDSVDAPRAADAAADSSTPVADAAATGDAHSEQVAHWRTLSKARQDKRRRPTPWWIEIPALIVVAFLVTFLIQTFVARVYYVPSGSMERTLHGTTHGGDRILAYKLGYDFSSPEQGDVVVFKGPPTWTPEASIPGPSSWLGKIGQALGSVVGIAPPNEKDYVKRIIAVGGQTVSCCDAQGRVQVDGTSLHEPYLFMDLDSHPRWKWIVGESSCAIDPEDRSRYESFRCFGPYTVPKDTVWVMGDHRSDSADSTAQCRGLVPADNVDCQGPIPVDDIVGKAVFIVMPPSRWGTIGSPDPMDAGSP